MRIIDIENQILEVREKLKKIQSEQRKASVELQDLKSKQEQKYRQGFIEFIEIGFKHQFSSFTTLSGVQTGLSKTDKPESPYFRSGDEIEVIKKNRASFVVRCVSKAVNKFDKSVGKNVSVNTSGQTFRIEIDSLYYHLTNKEEFLKQLTTYINRKDALSDLLED